MNEMPDGHSGRIARVGVTEWPGIGVNEMTNWMSFQPVSFL